MNMVVESDTNTDKHFIQQQKKLGQSSRHNLLANLHEALSPTKVPSPSYPQHGGHKIDNFMMRKDTSGSYMTKSDPEDITDSEINFHIRDDDF